MNVLSEVLALVNPLAFGLAARVRSTVDGMLKRLQVENSWQLEIAAMLAPLGCVTIPESVLQKYVNGDPLSDEQKEMVEDHPRLSARLIREIPRLDTVAKIIEAQSGHMPSTKSDDLATQALALATRLEECERRAESPLHALASVRDKCTHVEPAVMDALIDFVKSEKHQDIIELAPSQLSQGMVLAEDVCNQNGTLLMAKGQKITAAALKMIENCIDNDSVDKIKIVDTSLCGVK